MKLILKCWSSNEDYSADCDFAKVEIDSEHARVVRDRMDMVKRLKAEDVNFHRLTFWDRGPDFFGYPRASEDDQDEGGAGRGEERRSLLDRVDHEERVEAEVTLTGESIQRMDYVFLHVTEDDVWWEGCPKHASVLIDTAHVGREALERASPMPEEEPAPRLAASRGGAAAGRSGR